MEIADPRVDPTLLPEGSRARVINGPHREYRDLPSVVTPQGRVITRWTPTEAERAQILAGEDIYVTILAGGPINPFYVTVGPVNWRAEAEEIG